MRTSITSFQGEFRFLSNFWPATVELDGEIYPTVEHAYQAAKTNDPAERALVRSAPTPGKAKRMGRSVTKRLDWDAVKVGVMKDLLQQKFAEGDPNLTELLLSTGMTRLVEGNTWGDRFWGVCNGKGENVLGRLLMKVRADIRRRS